MPLITVYPLTGRARRRPGIPKPDLRGEEAGSAGIDMIGKDVTLSGKTALAGVRGRRSASRPEQLGEAGAAVVTAVVRASRSGTPPLTGRPTDSGGPHRRAVYCPTEFAVRAISERPRQESAGGIRASLVSRRNRDRVGRLHLSVPRAREDMSRSWFAKCRLAA